MISEIGGAVSALKSLKDISTFILNSKIDNAVKAKAIELNFTIIELQSAIFDLQAKHQTVLDEKDNLKKQLMQKKQWKAEAAKYELKAVDSGVFVYALKREKGNTEPAHWLCTKCYQFEQKSVLQRTSKNPLAWIYTCFTCQNSFATAKAPDSLMLPNLPA